MSTMKLLSITSRLNRQLIINRTIHVGRSLCSTQVASQSIADSNQILSPTETSPKIKAIVDEIGKLTLLEVAELNVALKEVLKIPDAPMMSFAAGAMMAGMPGDKAAKSDEDADAASKTVQTAFTLKITKFDEGKKVALIKEVKNLVEGLNLVQAKKFVESLPQVVKNNLSKEEAEKLKSTLESVGATCSID
ncbi:mitochondrial ribosomal protein L12 [Dermatophagoides pteronyssinus]|uniref:Ribosomal protein n=2 Tax=Dermatophagoides pteronyssinus TaxID=6956 RepID=A0ABQ8IWV8_DERPT|nr:39S ribosomal protein L12, mitochondrial-like [Dermatophagoides pteronyssinus]KAH9414774.1 Ribosomal protein [Dermatophagoides pteronyssinus]